jgi:hypothetical protein
MSAFDPKRTSVEAPRDINIAARSRCDFARYYKRHLSAARRCLLESVAARNKRGHLTLNETASQVLGSSYYPPLR